MNLNEKVTIYRKRDTRAADGSLSQTRDEVCAIFCAVKVMSGSERSQSNTREAYGTYRFTTHRRSDIQEKDIAVWNSTDFNIHFIGDQGSKFPYYYFDAERGGAM